MLSVCSFEASVCSVTAAVCIFPAREAGVDPGVCRSRTHCVGGDHLRFAGGQESGL